MAREVRLWKWLHTGLNGTPGLDLRRVENTCEVGTPDVEACWEGRCFWLELKAAQRPMRPTTAVDLKHVRDGQVAWLRRRWRCGGLAWLYVRVGEGRATSRFLVPGPHAREIRAGVTVARLSELSVLPPDHDQAALLRAASGLDLSRQAYDLNGLLLHGG